MKEGRADGDLHGPGANARVCSKSDVAAQYQQHHERLRRTANWFFRGRRPDMADEAIGIVFTHLLNLVDKGKLTDQGDRWDRYLHRTVINCCVDLVRRENRSRDQPLEIEAENPRIIDPDPVGDAIADHDQTHRRQARLGQAVSTLNDRQVTIVRHVLAGRTNKQIGEDLSVSGQAVGQQLKTILIQLHEEVTRDE